MKKGSKKKIIIFVVLIMLIGGGVGGYFGYNYYLKQKALEDARLKQEEEDRVALQKIKENYNTFVKSNDDINIYILDNDKYQKMGTISKDTSLQLEPIENITLNNKYLKLANSDYFVNYLDISPSEEVKYDTNYKHYVPFDNDIVTKNPTNFYKNNQIIYTINDSFTLPIIINDNDYYYVEFDDQLFGIKKDNVEKTVENKRNISVASEIGVINYHFFNDSSKGEICPEIICLDTAKFEEQLKYLKDNGFYTATMQDMNLWIHKKIRLPKKTAVLTIDDGAMGTDTHLPRLLEKYDLHGTLFLITAWWSKDKYISPNLEIQSHGDNIHNYTAEALYKTKAQLLEDFQKSIKALDGEKTAFCYPFYAHNETVRSAVQESEFQIAFVGGNVKANQNNNPYQISRYVMYSYTTLDQFISMVN